MSDETVARIYALDLLNRAGVAFDARDVATVAKIIPVMERDMGAFLEAAGMAVASAYVFEGTYRPAQPEPITDMRSNVR